MTDARDEVGRLISAQREYYDLRAPDYADVSRPTDRASRGPIEAADARRLVDEFDPSGDVLELACGPGLFTRELVRHARSLTAVDGSQVMIDLNRRAIGEAAPVEFVRADLFDWEPPRRFDQVFFGFWISHVPPTHFDSFWSMVGRCVTPGGRVGFVDEDDRARAHESELGGTLVPTARRTLSDGRSFEIIKIFWTPDALRERLGEAGWRSQVRRVGASFLYGVAEPSAG